MCKPSVVMLNQSDVAQFYKCECCDRYNLNYKNLFLHFKPRSLDSFLKTLRALEGRHFTQYHPEGMKAIISKGKTQIGMGFTRAEADELIVLIEQSLIIDQANKVISKESI